MLHFLASVIFGIIVTTVMWFIHKKKISNKELLYSLGANAAVAVFSILIFNLYFVGKSSDHETLNGYVLSKTNYRVSCEHSKSCKCKQVDGKEVCKTCYDHPYDVNWLVETTVGTNKIAREDRQGLREPKRWSAVVIGEPASTESHYYNPLLFRDDESLAYRNESVEMRFKEQLLPYPEVYDYYRVERVLNTTSVKTEFLNQKLSDWLKVKGSDKQLNLIYVLTYQPVDYFYALMSSWAGGKKNDFIVVIGFNERDNSIAWVEANAYAKGMNNRALISEIKLDNPKVFSESLVDKHLSWIDQQFKRMPAEYFASKRNEISIPFWFTAIVLLANILASYFVSRYMVQNDLK